MKTTIQAFKIAFKASPIGVSLYIILSLLFSVLTTYPSLIAYKMITELIITSIETGTFQSGIFLWLIVLVLANVALYELIHNIRNYIYNKSIPKITMLVNMMCLKKLYELEHDTYFKTEFLDSFERVKQERSRVANYVTNLAYETSTIMVGISLIIGVVFILDTLPVLIFLTISIIMALISGKITRKEIKLRGELNQKWRENAYYESLLSERRYTKEVRLNKLQNKLKLKWRNYFTYVKDKWLDFDTKSNLFWSIFVVIQNLLGKSYVFYLVYITYLGQIDVSTMVMLVAGIQVLMNTIVGAIRFITSWVYTHYKSTKVVLDFIEGKNLETVKLGLKDLNQSTNLRYNEFKSIEFKDVTYRYPSQNSNAVENLNFKINRGEIVSILGYNGSGKTTLSKLMTSTLTPKSGKILLNGNKYQDITQNELSVYFGVAFQEFNRYSFTLKDNIRLGYVEKHNEQDMLEEAYKNGNLKSIINKLPDGENTLLGKEFDVKGNDLSGGEWQKLILSRAYFGNNELVILDEPTASIDPFEELRMLERFRTIIGSKTALLISHRIGFARLADRILFMSDGKIIEQGTHQELLEIENGKYRELFQSQKELYERGDVGE